MSIVVPFRALRPRGEFVGAVAALPYDVMSVEEARQQIKKNPLSFLRVEKAECDFPGEEETAEQIVCQRAKDNLERMIKEGILGQDESASFYLYRQQMGGHVQTGVVACVSVDEYRKGRIKAHELTLEAKERGRTLHIDSIGAQTGPVFLTYRGQEQIDSLLAKVAKQVPEYDFTADDGIRHTAWIIGELADIKALQKAFLPVEYLYIADGHHRAAAAVRVAGLRAELSSGKSKINVHKSKINVHKAELSVHKKAVSEHDFMLAVLFPSDQLRIMDYNRAVRDLNGLARDEFLEEIADKFLIAKDFPEKAELNVHKSKISVHKLPRRPHDFGMYLQGKWYLLSAREKALPKAKQAAALDVSVLQDNILGPVLGIENPRTDKRIAFIGGARGAAGLESIVDRDGFAVAFSLFPPTVEQMMAVADAGMVMPPKSTWFEPKLRSGLFVHLID
ncbi:MAG: DUF1015 family protein [Syntrophales bacterium]|jgi:uncharacterized protein (DUF1015 family)|nr:DUF1015 family protein [Syntrophales bacterium]